MINLKQRHFRINYPLLITFILIFALFPPKLLMINNVLDALSKGLLLIVFIILLYYTVRNKRFNIYIYILFCFLIWNTLSSYVLLNNFSGLVNNIRIATLVLLINLFIKKYTYSLLKSLNIVFSSYIIINFITYIFFRDGIYIDNPREAQYRPAWFLDIENQFADILIPGVIIVIIYSIYQYGRINLFAWLVLTITGVTIFMASSATATVTFFFILISFLIINSSKLRKCYNYITLSLGYMVVWLLTININKFSSVSPLIEKVLGKDITLSGRTEIWKKVFEVMPESIWTGFGHNTWVVVEVFWDREYRAHNMILQMVLDNGLISLVLFFILFILVGVKITKSNNNLKYYIMLGVFAILITGLTESYRVNNLFLFLSLGFYIDNLLRKDVKHI